MIHAWRFFHAGGVDQARLDSGKDLRHLDSLDQKLWMALACPTKGLDMDERTLALIDTDGDGRIRAPELVAAVAWACRMLANPDHLTGQSPVLPLERISDGDPEAAGLKATARELLASLGKPEAAEISVADTVDSSKIFGQLRLNGDGVVTAGTALEPDLAALIADIVACLGPETDRSGQPGVHKAKAEQFFAGAEAHLAWLAKAGADPAALPLGPATGAAHAAVQALRAKAEDYFVRCRLAAFDGRAAKAVNREEKDYQALAAADLTLASPAVAALPLAEAAPGRPLPLAAGVNPAWAAATRALREWAVVPLLGDREALAEEEWVALVARLEPHGAWLAAKAGAEVEKLGEARLREILAGDLRPRLFALIAEDVAQEGKAKAVESVERLARYHRDLHRLCLNFVNFKTFYGRAEPALFQAGRLFMDQRTYDLCVRVEDAGKHAALAGQAGTYLAYCDCTRKDGGRMQVVAAVTDGDSGNLMVGRNGVFYDRKGRDWDATIIRVIDNPISLRQAFWSPYTKFVSMLEAQVAKRAAAAEAEANADLERAAASAAATGKVDPGAPLVLVKPAPGASGAPKKLDVGVVAALGVALGAIGTFLATIFTKMVELQPWQLLMVALCVVAAISGPSVFIAWLKLRKRNLGPLLDATGWAMNSRARMSVAFGASLTRVARLPAGARRDIFDPYADRKNPWPTIVVGAILLWILYRGLDHVGFVHQWSHGRLGTPPAAAATPASGPGQP